MVANLLVLVLVLDFDSPETADAALAKLRAPRRQKTIELLDACVVIRPEMGDMQMLGGLAGAAMDAASGSLADFGIDDEFVRESRLSTKKAGR